MFRLKNWMFTTFIFLTFWLSPFFWINFFSILYYNGKGYKKIVRNKKVVITKNFISLSDGYKLATNYQIFANKKPLFIFVHGLGAHLHETMWLEKIFIDKQYSYLNYSRRHSGINADSHPKKYSLNLEVDDCKEILITLRNLHPTKKIVVIGHSLGAIFLLKTAILPEIQALGLDFALINVPTQVKIVLKKIVLKKIFLKFFLRNFSNNFVPFSKYITPSFYPAFVNCSKNCNNKSFFAFFKFSQKKKVDFSSISAYMNENGFTFRKLPFYYFFYLKLLVQKALEEIHQNKKNKIVFFQSENDIFLNRKIYQKYQKNWNNGSNIKVITLKIISHRFFLEDISNQKYFLKYILPEID